MRFEFSAGGVVYKHETTLNRTPNNANILILVAQHSQHHGWVFPKGLIGDRLQKETKETQETKEEAALREVEEETGIIAEIVSSLTPTTFWYQFKDEKIKKTVYYFLMKHVGGDITKHDHEMEHVEWLPIDKVSERLTYKSDKTVWKEAEKELLSYLR